MTDCNFLLIPVNESDLNKKIIFDGFKFVPPVRLVFKPKESLGLECKNTSNEKLDFEKDSILSDPQVSGLSSDEKQKVDLVSKNDANRLKKKRKFFENKVEKCLSDIQKVIRKKMKSSLDSQTKFGKEQILDDQEITLDHETESKKKKENSIRRSTRKRGLLKNKYQALVHDKNKQIYSREKNGISGKQSIKKISFKKEDTSNKVKKNSNIRLMTRNLIKFNGKKEEVPLKKERKVGRPKKIIRPSDKKQASSKKINTFVKRRGKKEDVSSNKENISSSKLTSLNVKLRKSKTDYTAPIFHEPFKHGWKREVVHRAFNKQSRADVYYYTPDGQKLRSFIAIKRNLNVDGLTLANFTFHKGSVGIADSEKEIVRYSTRAKKCVTMTQKIKGRLLKIPKQKEVFPRQNKNLSTKENKDKGTKKLKNISASINTMKVIMKDKNEKHGFNNVNKNSSFVSNSYDISTTSTTEDTLDTHTNEKLTIFEKKIESLADKKTFSTSENILTSTLLSSDESSSLLESDLDKSKGLNNLHNNFDNTISITDDDSTKKIESLPNALHVQSSSIYQGTLTTATKTSESCFPTKTPNENVESSDNYMKFEKLSENDINLGSLKVNEINKISELNTSRKNSLEKTESNSQRSQIEQSESKKNFENVNEVYRCALLPEKAVNNTEIISEEIKDFKGYSMHSKTSLHSVSNEIANDKNSGSNSLKTTPVKQNSPLKLNCSDFKRIKFSLPKTSVHLHSITSFCAGFSALKLIFSYLNIEDLLVAKRVCKVWKELADLPILWKKVRINKNQVTDTLANILQKQGTEHLVVIKEDDDNWETFINAISRIKNLRVLELCSCPPTHLETIVKHCPQLQIIGALPNKRKNLNIEYTKNLYNLEQLYLKAITNTSFKSDFIRLPNFLHLTHLSIRYVKNLGKKNIEVIRFLQNLNILELGECSEFDSFGSNVLVELKNLKRLKLEKIEASYSCTDILTNVSKLEKLTDLELVNINITEGFDEHLSKCKNIAKLVLIPIYKHQSALSNNIILKSTTELTSNLKHFIWGISEELFKLSKLFFEQSEDDWIPFLKPIPHIDLLSKIINTGKQGLCRKQLRTILNILVGVLQDEEKFTLNTSRLDMLSLTSLQKLYTILLPETTLDILKIAT